MNRWLLNYEWQLILVAVKTFWGRIWIFPLAKIRCASSCRLACLTHPCSVAFFHLISCSVWLPRGLWLWWEILLWRWHDVLGRDCWTLKDGYIQKLPLPRVPRIQSASHVCHTHDTCYSGQVTRIPMRSDLVRLLAGLGRSTLQPFSLLLV